MSLFGNLTASSITDEIDRKIKALKKEQEEATGNTELNSIVKGLEMARSISAKYEY